MKMPFPRIWPRVYQFLRIDAGGRRAGDIADVVGPRATGTQPQIVDRFDHGRSVVRVDLTDLDIGACGHMSVAAAVALGEIGQAGKFSIFDNAVRDPQSAHIGVLVRRDIEQAAIAPAEIVGWLGIFTPDGVLLQPLVSVERMLFAFKSLLIGKVAASCENAVLRLERGGVGPYGLRGLDEGARHRGLSRASRRSSNLHAGEQPFEIPFLFGFEIARLPRADEFKVGLGHSPPLSMWCLPKGWRMSMLARIVAVSAMPRGGAVAQMHLPQSRRMDDRARTGPRVATSQRGPYVPIVRQGRIWALRRCVQKQDLRGTPQLWCRSE